MIEQAVQFLRSQTTLRPRVGVVLGSGLGGFVEELAARVEVPYEEIPGWPPATAVGHAGKLALGSLGNLPVAVMAGRAHLYEGCSPAEVVFGVRVLGRFGVRSLVVTNAAGGIHPSFERGRLALISDHINLQGANPLAGPNDDSLGPRFPDMSEAYSSEYRAIAREEARQLGIELPEGVYAAVLGPAYETPAEVRFLRTIGADLVGMSTVAEVTAANHMGLRVLAISCVANKAVGLGDGTHKITHEEVLEAGESVQQSLARLLKAVLPRL